MKTYIKIIIIFLTLMVINSFIMWTEPIWLKILPFFEEKTLINPTIDYIIKFLVFILLAVQLPALGLFDLFEKIYSFNRIEAIFTISLLSTGLFFLYVELWKLLLRIKYKYFGSKSSIK